MQKNCIGPFVSVGKKVGTIGVLFWIASIQGNVLRRVTFLSLHKKVTKEVSSGETLSVALPRRQAALP